MAHSFAFVDSEGDPKGLISCGSDDQYVHLQTYGDTQAVIVSSGADNDSIMVTGWYNLDTNEWSTRVACPAPYYVWKNKQWSFNSERFWVHVRHERDLKLGQSDWTQMSDVNFNAGVKTAWINYRQALRNVPGDNADCVSINDIVWPSPPS